MDLTHLDATGAARMVDVSGKQVTTRTATASGFVSLLPETVELVRAGAVAKGDVLAVVRIACVTGAKQTAALIPLCHPLPLHAVDVALEVRDDGIALQVTVRTAERTGVEMEALAAVAIGGLTVIDMVKAVDRAAALTDVAGRGEVRRSQRRLVPDVRVRVLTVSDRVAAGTREDTSGPLLAALLSELGEVDGPSVVADDAAGIAAAVQQALDLGFDLVVTTGGTGIGPRDVTPEAVRPLIGRDLPGIAEAIRSRGAAAVPTAVLSRGVSGVTGRSLVVTLPGSTGGVRDGAAVLLAVAAHVVDQLHGGDHG